MHKLLALALLAAVAAAASAAPIPALAGQYQSRAEAVAALAPYFPGSGPAAARPPYVSAQCRDALAITKQPGAARAEPHAAAPPGLACPQPEAPCAPLAPAVAAPEAAVAAVEGQVPQNICDAPGGGLPWAVCGHQCRSGQRGHRLAAAQARGTPRQPSLRLDAPPCSPFRRCARTRAATSSSEPTCSASGASTMWRARRCVRLRGAAALLWLLWLLSCPAAAAAAPPWPCAHFLRRRTPHANHPPLHTRAELDRAQRVCRLDAGGDAGAVRFPAGPAGGEAGRRHRGVQAAAAGRLRCGRRGCALQPGLESCGQGDARQEPGHGAGASAGARGTRLHAHPSRARSHACLPAAARAVAPAARLHPCRPATPACLPLPPQCNSCYAFTPQPPSRVTC